MHIESLINRDVFASMNRIVLFATKDKLANTETIQHDLYWKLDIALFSILSITLQNKLHSEILLDLKTELK